MKLFYFLLLQFLVYGCTPPNNQISVDSPKTNDLVEFYTKIESKNTPFLLNKDLLFGTENHTYNITEFYDKVVREKSLILRMTDIDCTICVDSVIRSIRISKIDSNDVIVLASYGNKRNLNIWKRLNQINYPILTVPEFSISPIDSLRIPYVFTLEKAKFRSADKLFIPDKVIPERTLKYLNESYSK